MHKLDRLFNPRSVAVVGAKQVDDYRWLHTVINFSGPKYNVNIDEREWPGATQLGFPNYKSLLDISDEVDLVIISVPAAVVPRVLADCIAKKVYGVHLYTAGFGETRTEEGIRLEEQVVKMAREADLKLVGPNCLGIFNPKLNLGFPTAGYGGESGNLAFISQSGSQSGGFISEAREYGFKVSKLVSMGNGIVLDSAEYLEYFGQDEDTQVIGTFLEGVRDGERFFSVLREVGQRKPVLVWKVGETESAARATSVHSATQFIPPALWDSMLRQCGAVKVHNLRELVDTAKVLLYARPFTGTRLGLMCQGGGHSTAMANVFSNAGFQAPALTERTQERIAADFNIVGGSYHNPLEGRSLRDNEFLAQVLDILDEDENLDAIVQEFPSGLLRNEPADGSRDHRLDTFCAFATRAKKPYIVSVDPGMPPPDPEQSRWVYDRFREAGVPAISSFERAATALRKAVEYHRSRSS